MFSDAAGQVVFFAASGKAIAASPPMTDLAADPVDALITRNRKRGVEPDWRSGLPAYGRDGRPFWEHEVAVPEALEVSKALGEPADAA